MDAGVAGHDLATGAGGRAAAQVAGAAAGLLDQEQTRGDVPGMQLELPETIAAAGGDVAEGEGGAAVAVRERPISSSRETWIGRPFSVAPWPRVAR